MLCCLISVYHIIITNLVETEVTYATFSTRGKYCHNNLLIGVSNSPELFQQKMNDLFQGFEFIGLYIYEL